MSSHAEKIEILIVQGSSQTSVDLEGRLLDLGYLVCGKAVSGQQALELAERRRPDLVLMDIILPGEMDGIDTASVMREKWGIPVVMLAESDHVNRLKHAKLSYPFGYLLKPVQDINLETTVEMTLYVAKVDAERRKAETALKKNEALLNETGRMAKIGGWEHNLITGEGRWTQALYDIIELEPGPVPGPGEHLSYYPEEDRKKLQAAYYQAVNDGKPFDLTLKAFTAKGRTIWCRATGEPVYEDEKCVKMKGTFQDITEHKQAEDAINAFFDQTLVMLFIADIEHNKIVRVNNKVVRITGHTEEELAAIPFIEFVHPEDRDATRNAILKLTEGEPLVGYRTRYLAADGNVLLFEWNAVSDADRKLVFAMAQDITERVRAEEDRDRLRSQLQQAQKMEAVGTLAGGIAHDFNNLLQAINGYSQILLFDKKEQDPDYTALKTIQNAGNRAADLVRQLLLFSRKADTERKPVDLNHEIDQARKVLDRTIPKMIEIQVHPERNLWAVNADPVQVEQILLNLGANAADAMPDGGKFIIETKNITLKKSNAHTKLGLTPGNYVLLSVSDTGHGMDPKTQEHIFEPFYTTKGIGKGTGLGLATVYGIVQNHGGIITCESKINQGTKFEIYLPAFEMSETNVRPDTPGETPRGGSETILIVDDEEFIRDFASEVLNKFGYSVLTASSGEQALEVFSKRSLDIKLVLLDIGMPGIGGHRCLQEMLLIDPKVKILIASGYSMENEVKKTLEAGAAGYVGKPYQMSDLLKKARDILDRE
jgi:PAS domain S-box-containing protein